MYIKIDEYFKNSFNLNSRIYVESLEVGAKEYGGATEIDGIIFSIQIETNKKTDNQNKKYRQQHYQSHKGY